MPNIFSLMGTAWDFFRSQPVLNTVLVWLLVLPMSGMFAVADLQMSHPALKNATLQAVLYQGADPMPFLGVAFLQLLLTVLLLWGIACVLLVGRKLLQNRAGRARTSFAVVRQEAGHYVATLLLTDILRACATILWGLLLIVPGIIYFIRTFFFYIAIVCEGQGFRDALRQSNAVVKGQTATAGLYLLGLCAFIFLPLAVADTFVANIVYLLAPSAVKATYVLSSLLYGTGGLLFLLSTIPLYRELKKAS